MAFRQHGGKTYQIATDAPAQAMSGYDATFRRILESFGPVTDRSVLGVQPQRIDIVTLPGAMSLAQFRQRNEIDLPVEPLAVINQVQDPNAPLPAGTMLKRVKGRAPSAGTEDIEEIGAPGEIRTPDPLVRSQVLYPTELRARRLELSAACFRHSSFSMTEGLAEREGFEPSKGF